MLGVVGAVCALSIWKSPRSWKPVVVAIPAATLATFPLGSGMLVWVACLPVLYATDRAQKDFQPIRYFVPGFITDETQTTPATAANGLDINGNSVKVLHIFTFNRDALVPQENADSVDYDDTIGGGTVHLVG